MDPWKDAPDWLSYSPASGVVAPGASQEIEVNFSAVDLEGGDYALDITITSNDEDEPTVTVPVTMSVDPLYADIGRAPESLNEELYGEDLLTQVLTITNNGNSDAGWTSSLGDDATFGGFWPGESQSRDALSISEVVNRFNGRRTAAMMRGRGGEAMSNTPNGIASTGTRRDVGPAARTVQGNNRSTRSLDVAVIYSDIMSRGDEVVNLLAATEQFNTVTGIDAQYDAYLRRNICF